MSASWLDLGAGAVLLCAVTILWQRSLRGIVRTLALQGLALAGVAVILGVRRHDALLVGTGALVLVSKAIVIPELLRRVLRLDPALQETSPVVNFSASLVASTALTFLAFATTRPLVTLVSAPAGPLVPFGVATVLVGFFVLVARRMAASQIAGLLLVDNGIGLVAFLVTAGVPLLIELGVSLDVLLIVVVLRVLATRMQTQLGGLDLDALTELRD
ncbi:MAG: hypothetical protein ACRDV0_03265 [Acidimicrobiales bacterium]